MRELLSQQLLASIVSNRRVINHAWMRYPGYFAETIISQINKYFVISPLPFEKFIFFFADMTHVITFHYLLRVWLRALPRFIWFEFVGNIYDLAFTAKLTLIWSQTLIYDLPALINVQLQLKMQHLHFAISAFVIRIDMYTHLHVYSSIVCSSFFPFSLRLFTSKFEEP